MRCKYVESKVRKKLLFWTMVQGMVASVALVAAAFLLAVVGDAVFDFSTALRRAFPWLVAPRSPPHRGAKPWGILHHAISYFVTLNA